MGRGGGDARGDAVSGIPLSPGALVSRTDWEFGSRNWCLEPGLPGPTGFQRWAWSAEETETRKPWEMQLLGWFLTESPHPLQLAATENMAVFC